MWSRGQSLFVTRTNIGDPRQKQLRILDGGLGVSNGFLGGRDDGLTSLDDFGIHPDSAHVFVCGLLLHGYQLKPWTQSYPSPALGPVDSFQVSGFPSFTNGWIPVNVAATTVMAVPFMGSRAVSPEPMFACQ